MCPFLLLLRWIGNNKTMQSNDNMLKWWHTSAKSWCYPACTYLDPMIHIDLVSSLYNFWHQIAIFILAHFGTFREFQPCFEAQRVASFRHMSQITTPSFARSRATPICIFNRCRWIFFTPWVTERRNVTCQLNKTNGPLNGWNTKNDWVEFPWIRFQFKFQCLELGHVGPPLLIGGLLVPVCRFALQAFWNMYRTSL